ncbi:MAG: dipeptidase [Desulfobacteraceae bacterium]|jgi:membrane dipeptidase
MNQVKAAILHRESMIIDGLNASYFFEEEVLKRLKKGGITAVHATVAAWHILPETIHLIAGCFSLFERHADLIMPVHSVEDIERAKAKDRVGFILGFQDTNPIDDNPNLLAIYYALGVRIIQLTYNHRNRAGYGCMAPEDEGLTPFGRDLIVEMNRRGILIDLSHCGPRTTLEAIEASQSPVAFTHANAVALASHPRNKTDEALRTLAAREGVVGVVALPAMLTGQAQASLNDYLAAIDYLVNLIGVDHVGIGPDFMEEMPEEVIAPALRGISQADKEKLFGSKEVQGFESISDCPKVTEGLLTRGYNPEEVKKIMGGNWMRLYKQVWQ